MNKNKLFFFAAVSAVLLFTISAFIGCETSEQRNCVVMLGDSIFALSGAEPNALMSLAGQKYRTYYQNGAELSGGNLIAPRDILGQYAAAQRAGHIRTIIMDGGGNDFLISDNSNIEEELKQAWGELLDKAQADGVENIVVQGYYRTCSATADQLDGQSVLATDLAAAGRARGIKLVFYNPAADPWFSGKLPRSYTIADCIHPNTETSRHMAEQLWNLMVQNDIEQGAGCADSGGGCN